MPWQGQKDNLIDRFDVRAHLDYIPPPRKEEQQEEKITEQDRQANYESYRVLAQNEFLGINESDFLRQVQMEEQFGSAEKGGGDSDKKKKNSQANAAIGYTYEDSTAGATTSVPFSQQILSIETSQASSSRFEEFAKDFSDESDIDMDVQVDVKKIGTAQAHELNNFGKKYGMTSNDLFSYLTRDEEEKQSLKAMKEQEADKILGGGRKSRRERRSQREKRILGKPLTFSPPSYAAKEEKLDKNVADDESDKSSRESKSPSVEKITYITSFGGEEELQPHSKISIPFKKTMPKNLVNLRRNETFADKVRENSDKLRQLNDSEKKKHESRRSRSRSSSRHRRRSRSSSRRRRYRSRDRSYSRRRYSSRSRSRSRRRNYRHSSRSYSRSYSRSRSRSVSRGRYSSRRRSSSYKRRNSYKSRSRRRSSSRERSRNRRKYSSSSSSSTSTSSSSSSHRSSTSSPEKRSHKEKSVSIPKEKSKTPIREKRASSSPKAIPSTSDVQPPPPAVVKRYYGRKRDNDSSSSLSVDSDDNDDRQTGSNER